MKKIFKIITVVFLLVSLGNIIYNSLPQKSYYNETDLSLYEMGVRFDNQFYNYYSKNIKVGDLKTTYRHVNLFRIRYDLLYHLYGGSSFTFGKHKGYYKKRYYPNGLIESEGIGGVNDNLNMFGKWKFYHENGKIKFEGDFDGRKPTGIWKVYSVNGNLVKELKYSLEEWEKPSNSFWLKCFDDNGHEIKCN